MSRTYLREHTTTTAADAFAEDLAALVDWLAERNLDKLWPRGHK